MRKLLGAGALALLVAAAALAGGCGGDCRVLLSGGLVLGCGDEPPGPGDPAYGTAAEILLEDCGSGALLWVGIDFAPTPTPGPGGGGTPPNVFDEFEELLCAGELEWIGGTVVVANDHPQGFFFAPSDIVVLSSAPEELRTTISAIARDPGFFAPGGEGGRERWVVPATLLAVETSEPLACAVTPAC